MQGKDIVSQCHMEAAGAKSLAEVVQKKCSFKGDEMKEYHHKAIKCILDKGKDNDRVKEWEEKRKGNKEEFKKAKREALMKDLSCKQQALGLQ